MGQSRVWIQTQLRRARLAGAPETAIYKYEGRWIGFFDIQSEGRRRMISDKVAELEQELKDGG